MRWNPDKPKPKEERIKKTFLMLPYTLPYSKELSKAMGTVRETRWLEWAYIKQVYHYDEKRDCGWWTDVKFISLWDNNSSSNINE